MLATDGTGAPVLTIDALTLRATTGDHLRRQITTGPEHDLLHLTWSALPGARTDAPDSTGWALLDTDPRLTEALDALPCHASPAALTAAVDREAAPPELVVWSLPAQDQADAEGAWTLCEHVLHFLQEWLADNRLTRTVLAVVTRHAVVTGPHDPPGLADGPAWGLLHTAQNENPGRIVLVDTDRHPDSAAALTAVWLPGTPSRRYGPGSRSSPGSPGPARPSCSPRRPTRPTGGWRPPARAVSTDSPCCPPPRRPPR